MDSYEYSYAKEAVLNQCHSIIMAVLTVTNGSVYTFQMVHKPVNNAVDIVSKRHQNNNWGWGSRRLE